MIGNQPDRQALKKLKLSVETGQLQTLVPVDEPLQGEVQIKNEDVGFVHEGQSVKVKLAAYPFQKYGMVEGTITHVGADANDGQPNQAK